MSRKDRVGKEHGQDQGTEQRSQFLEQVPAVPPRIPRPRPARRAGPGSSRPDRARAAPHDHWSARLRCVSILRFKLPRTGTARPLGRPRSSRIDPQSPLPAEKQFLEPLAARGSHPAGAQRACSTIRPPPGVSREEFRHQSEPPSMRFNELAGVDSAVSDFIFQARPLYLRDRSAWRGPRTLI